MSDKKQTAFTALVVSALNKMEKKDVPVRVVVETVQKQEQNERKSGS